MRLNRHTLFACLAIAALAWIDGFAPAVAQADHGSQGAGSSDHSGHTAGPASEAYAKAMEAMHGPMMEGVRHPDPDVAFVLGMIPHHQGAIAMAEVQLKYGTDPENRKLAEEIISAQTREIAEMHEWLRKRGVPVPH